MLTMLTMLPTLRSVSYAMLSYRFSHYGIFGPFAVGFCRLCLGMVHIVCVALRFVSSTALSDRTLVTSTCLTHTSRRTAWISWAACKTKTNHHDD